MIPAASFYFFSVVKQVEPDIVLVGKTQDVTLLSLLNRLCKSFTSPDFDFLGRLYQFIIYKVFLTKSVFIRHVL